MRKAASILIIISGFIGGILWSAIVRDVAREIIKGEILRQLRERREWRNTP